MLGSKRLVPERVDGGGQVDLEALDAADPDVVAGQGGARVGHDSGAHARAADEALPAQGREGGRPHAGAGADRAEVGKRAVGARGAGVGQGAALPAQAMSAASIGAAAVANSGGEDERRGRLALMILLESAAAWS